MLHYGPVLDIVSVIFSGIEFLLGLGECVESVLYIFQRVSGGRNNPEHDHALRHDGIYNH